MLHTLFVGHNNNTGFEVTVFENPCLVLVITFFHGISRAGPNAPIH
jgi:hypothetical protein